MRKGGTKLSRTIRKRYTGVLVRDGQWTRRCPEPHCDWCVRGRAKRAWNRKQRQEAFVSQYIDDPVARRQRAGTHYWVGYDGKLHQTVRSSV